MPVQFLCIATQPARDGERQGGKVAAVAAVLREPVPREDGGDRAGEEEAVRAGIEEEKEEGCECQRAGEAPGPEGGNEPEEQDDEHVGAGDDGVVVGDVEGKRREHFDRR